MGAGHEYLTINDNYIENYNRPKDTVKIEIDTKVITMNEWYRKRLGITETKKEYNLTIATERARILAQIRMGLQHPQAVVRMATLLAIISVILGFIGLLPYLGKLLGLFLDIWQQSCICSNCFIICCP